MQLNNLSPRPNRSSLASRLAKYTAVVVSFLCLTYQLWLMLIVTSLGVDAFRLFGLDWYLALRFAGAMAWIIVVIGASVWGLRRILGPAHIHGRTAVLIVVGILLLAVSNYFFLHPVVRYWADGGEVTSKAWPQLRE